MTSPSVGAWGSHVHHALQGGGHLPGCLRAWLAGPGQLGRRGVDLGAMRTPEGSSPDRGRAGRGLGGGLVVTARFPLYFLQEEAEATGSEGRCVVGWGGAVTEPLGYFPAGGTGTPHLLFLHPHPPSTPPPAPSSGKPFVWVLGPRDQSRAMHFGGSRGMVLRPRGSGRPGETLLPAPSLGTQLLAASQQGFGSNVTIWVEAGARAC